MVDQPAFPACNEANVNGTMGMSLREWFAGQALAGVLTSCAHPQSTGPCGLDATAYAKLAFSIADAMLAARTEQQS